MMAFLYNGDEGILAAENVRRHREYADHI